MSLSVCPDMAEERGGSTDRGGGAQAAVKADNAEFVAGFSVAEQELLIGSRDELRPAQPSELRPFGQSGAADGPLALPLHRHRRTRERRDHPRPVLPHGHGKDHVALGTAWRGGP